MKKKNLAISAVLLASVLAAATAASAKETVRVGGLKGPTTMGIASLGVPVSDRTENNSYETTMVTAADELMAMVLNEEVDIALLPANVAAILYNKTQGGVKAVDINTLGVLYVTEMGDTIHSVEDLKGKTLYLTGKGTSPDFVIRYLLDQHGLTTEDVKLEYKSEAAEVVSVLAEDEHAVGLLPQPFVTVAQNKIEGLRMALDLTAEWDKLDNGSGLITGVIVARRDVVEANPGAVDSFLQNYAASVEWVNANNADAAQLIAEYGIIEAAPVAEMALPYCNIVCITGSEMKDKLSGYLQVLADAEPSSVGGTLPGDDFYYGG